MRYDRNQRPGAVGGLVFDSGKLPWDVLAGLVENRDEDSASIN